MSAASQLPRKGSEHDPAGNGRFNAEAAAWDSNPGLHALSAEAYKAIVNIMSNIADNPSNLDVLEIGCGTGILTLLMASHVRSITAADAAQGMITVLEQKLQKSGAPTNVIPVCELLESPESLALPPAEPTNSSGVRRKYDIITSHLVLHHIPDLRGVLDIMFGCLKPGGCIALTDFEDFGPDAHKFHSKMRMEGVVRHGICKNTMESMLREIGFVDVKCEVAWKMNKRVEKFEGEFDAPHGRPRKGQGVVTSFPFLCIYGRKRKESKSKL